MGTIPFAHGYFGARSLSCIPCFNRPPRETVLAMALAQIMYGVARPNLILVGADSIACKDLEVGHCASTSRCMWYCNDEGRHM
jgi:hypothetical protein